MTSSVFFRFAALAALMFAHVGCGQAPAPVSAPPPAVEPPAPPPQRARSRSLIEVLPGDADVAIGINAVQLRASQLFAELSPHVAEWYGDELTRINERCGIDALGAVQSIVITMNTQRKPDITYVVSGFERRRLVSCYRELRGARDEYEVVEDGAFTRLDHGSDAVWLGWVTDTTAIVRQGSDRAAIQARLDGHASLATNPRMMALLDRVSTESSLWMIAVVDTGILSSAGVQGVYATVDTGLGLALQGGAELDSEEQASALAVDLQRLAQMQSMDPMTRYFADVEVTPHGSDVLIELILNPEELPDLVHSIATDPTWKIFIN